MDEPIYRTTDEALPEPRTLTPGWGVYPRTDEARTTDEPFKYTQAQEDLATLYLAHPDDEEDTETPAVCAACGKSHPGAWDQAGLEEMFGDDWPQAEGLLAQLKNDPEARAMLRETVRMYEHASQDSEAVPGSTEGHDDATPQDDPPAEIQSWWLAVAETDLAAFQPKLRQYGSHDLLVVGMGLNPNLDRQQAMEAGVAFYVLGKAARAVEAYRNGFSASDDTWHDLTVYSMMARRIQQTGQLS
jgi:hypothetical protein